jgi:hypothetical protein
MSYDVNFLNIPFAYSDGTKATAFFDIQHKHIVEEEDKKVVISGFGRSGSNLVTEIVRASRQFVFTHFIQKEGGDAKLTWIEDRTLLTNTFVQVPRYGTKCVTDTPNFSWDDLKYIMDNYNLYILFCVRHPIDAMLSGIVRSIPWEEGGDSWWVTRGGKEREITKTRYDLEVEVGKVLDSMVLRYSFGTGIFVKLLEKYNDRVISVRLEDVIVDIETEVDRICSFLEINKTDYMLTPWKYLRHVPQRRRYSKGLDETQINAYKDLDNSFSGFFKGSDAFIKKAIEKLSIYISYWGYDT